MGLCDSLSNALIRDTNVRPPVTVQESFSIRETVEVMRSAGLGCAIVIDADSRAVGMFTEGILRHCLNESPSILADPVTTQMVSRLPWVSMDESVSVIVESMERHNIRFLAILDDDHHVVGITGQKSLMEFIAETFPEEILTQDPTARTYSSRKEGA